MESLKILFIRHAQTDYHDVGDRDGCDGNLTKTGEEQCKTLGQKLKDVKIDGYISSSLLRAFKTAAGVCNAKPDKPTIHICPEIIECGCTHGYYGCSEKYLNQYYKNTKQVEKLFGTENYEFFGDTAAENNLRAEKFLNYITENYFCGQTVAVFSHHGMLEYLIPTALGIETNKFSFAIDNISVTEVNICEDGKRILCYANKTL